MYFTTLTEREYENFINNRPVHFAQSIDQYRFRKNKSNDVHLVGVKDKDEVIGACLLSEARALKIFKYFYSHKGPVLDYKNEGLVQCFFKGLTKYLKKH
ncbi:aminoacyltransferase FemA domain protein [Staphylococcus epidermidis VCU128]|nr:aminoacyltransferase FemA domain protein [Staphylococcus epidermidis VCU128]